MSQEPEEDVKPKLSIQVMYDGARTFIFVLPPVVAWFKFTLMNSIAVMIKVKASTPFAKIFSAAEVCHPFLRLPHAQTMTETIRQRTWFVDPFIHRERAQAHVQQAHSSSLMTEIV